jgi:hypothetical protein
MDLETVTSHLASGDTSIFITGQVRAGLMGSPWEGRLLPIGIPPLYPRLADIALYRLGYL